MGTLKKNLRRYFIMGSQNCTRDPVNILEEAIAGGITAFQYREKGNGSLNGKDKMALGLKLRELCQKNQVLFIVNDDLDLLEPLDADGIHVGQDDVSIEKIRGAFPNKIIGLSVSNADEVKQSPIHLADYLGAGPIYSTSTKEDAKEAVGLKWIQTLRAQFPAHPIVGIGGINVSNAHAVIEMGADGVSIISAITQAEDIIDVVRRLPK
jgi:thiamine-phosphate pyrophosphorylase